MRGAPLRSLLYAALALLYLAHNDLWLWSDARRVLGIPVGLAYHMLYCVAATTLLALVVRFAWPSHLESENR